MNLHRSSEIPDWEQVDSKDRSPSQKVAAITYGAITPANLITIAGVRLVENGIIDIKQGQKARGVAKVAIGRLADIADGYVADLFKHKGPFGKKLDIFADKNTKAAIAITDVTEFNAPKLVVGTTVGLGIAESVLAFANRDKWDDLQPSVASKVAATLEFSYMGLYAVADILKDHGSLTAAKTIRTLGHVAAAGAISFRAKALMNLASDLRDNQETLPAAST